MAAAGLPKHLKVTILTAPTRMIFRLFSSKVAPSPHCKKYGRAKTPTEDKCTRKAVLSTRVKTR